MRLAADEGVADDLGEDGAGSVGIPQVYSASALPSSMPKSASQPANAAAAAVSPTKPDKPAWSWPNFFRNAVLLVGGIGLTVWIVTGSVLPNLYPKNFGVVVAGQLYRSGELTPAATRKVVNEHGIRTILDLGAHTLGTPEQAREEAVATALGVRYVRMPLFGDATGDPNQYVRALRLMTDPEAQPLLVHCAAGSERTGCAIALYRSIIEAQPNPIALAETEDFRHDPQGNPRLTQTFMTYRDEIARVYREGGLIEHNEPVREDGGLVTEPIPPLPSTPESTDGSD